MGTKPSTLAIMALGLVGWVLAAILWSEIEDMRGQMTDALKSAEMARSGLAADFQMLQVANGDLGAVKQKIAAAKSDLAALAAKIDKANGAQIAPPQ